MTLSGKTIRHWLNGEVLPPPDVSVFPVLPRALSIQPTAPRLLKSLVVSRLANGFPSFKVIGWAKRETY